MSGGMNKIAKNLYNIMTEKDTRKVKPYDVKAEVLRDDGNLVWVKIPGGIDETPVQKTNNANVGDTVMVRIANGKAWVAGNNSSPATDDTRANEAYQIGANAGAIADIAIKEAGRASEAANQAEVEAKRAEVAANEADRVANSAQTAANSAMYNLSIVEDVIGTVNWIANHAVYFASSDTIVQEKDYFTLTGVAIANPTGNPNQNGYYELIDSKYILSTDTEIDNLKTYYKVTASKVLEPSGNPSTIPYYERIIDEAIAQYIDTHLTLTGRGLSVTDGSRSSVLISSDGVTIYGSNGDVVGQYGEGAIIGDISGYHIEITGEKLSFVNGTGEMATEIAYMEYNELYIPRVVVVDSMQIGHWIWDAISSDNHLTLKWRG